MVTISTIDFVTATVVLGIAVAVAGSSMAVLRYYARALRIAPRKHGLLLWHIVAISGSVTGTWILLGLGQLAILGLVDTPRYLRLIGYGVCGITTVVAIVIIACEQRRRVRSTSSETTVTRHSGTTFDLERKPDTEQR